MANVHSFVYHRCSACVTILLMHLIVLGHPGAKSLSDALGHAYAAGVTSAGARAEVLALRDLSFDLQLRAGFSGDQALEPDLQQAQRLFEQASNVAWFFPTWWAAPPALVKGFIDRTFLPGWAFAARKGRSLPDRLLVGRSARVVTTMDSPGFWYWLWQHGTMHGAFVNATLRYVGFGPVRSTTLYRQRWRTPEQRAQWLALLERQGRQDAVRHS
jgi:NAD(P)H dehydrogenase (quinone)